MNPNVNFNSANQNQAQLQNQDQTIIDPEEVQGDPSLQRQMQDLQRKKTRASQMQQQADQIEADMLEKQADKKRQQLQNRRSTAQQTQANPMRNNDKGFQDMDGREKFGKRRRRNKNMDSFVNSTNLSHTRKKGFADKGSKYYNDLDELPEDDRIKAFESQILKSSNVLNNAHLFLFNKNKNIAENTIELADTKQTNNGQNDPGNEKTQTDENGNDISALKNDNVMAMLNQTEKKTGELEKYEQTIMDGRKLLDQLENMIKTLKNRLRQTDSSAIGSTGSTPSKDDTK